MSDITLVTIFTLNDDTTEVEEFEEDFEALAEAMRTQQGARGNQLGQSLRNPRVYTIVGDWASAEDYTSAVSGGDFFVYLSSVYHLATITSDLTTPVAQGGTPAPAAGCTAITTFALRDAADAEAFEQAFTAHAAWMAAQDGFVSYRLQKSQRHENTYVNVGQWRDPGAYKAVVSSPEFHADVARIGAIAEVTPDLVRPYAPGAGQLPKSA